MKKILALGAVLLVIAGLTYVMWEGGGKETQKINPAFTGYVSSFTSGIVSKETEIVVRLREEVSPEKQVDDITEDLFDFDPNIEGQAYWKDNQTIVFKPESALISLILFS